MKKAYEAGWPGGVMKTAFDGVPIHIPSEYMFAFTQSTYANCDNVSGHHLERVCREAERLMGTAATVAWAATQGVGIVRVHDVKAAMDVVKVIAAIQGRHYR